MNGCRVIGLDMGAPGGDRTVYTVRKGSEITHLFYSGDPVWIWINTKWYAAVFVRLFYLREETHALLGLWPRERAIAPISDLRHRRPSLKGLDIPALNPHQTQIQTDMFVEAK